MMDAKTRVAFFLLTADWHWLTVPVGTQKGQVFEGIGKLIEKLINIWKRRTVAVWIPRMLEKIKRLGPVNAIIHGGDLIESEFNEQGMNGRFDWHKTKTYVEEIRNSAAGNTPIYLAPGDHEYGYRLPMSKDPEGGINLQSIRNCMDIFGQPYEYFSIEHIHFVLLSSSLLIQSFSHRPEKEQEAIKNIAQDQISFLITTLLRIPAGEPILLFLHDPDALKKVDKIINDRTILRRGLEVNVSAFCGHLHSEWVIGAYHKLGLLAKSKWSRLMPEKIRKWAADNLERMEIFERYNLRVIPAPGGMMGIGKGFLTLSVFSDGSWEIQREKI